MSHENGKDAYSEFLKAKLVHDVPTGITDLSKYQINPMLFDFQKDIVVWALKRGRACIWAQCGLGKTFMQLEWGRVVADYTQKPVLIIAPLAVSEQTSRDEAPKLGLTCKICADMSDVEQGLNISNYEKLDKFDLSQFGGIVADESSIMKNFAGKIRNQLITAVVKVPFRLACTATPAPNDFMEIGNHAEFVGAMTYHEMLSMFFVHDGGDTAKWRLKGHARKAFFAWVAEWAVMIRKPSDLGYSDDGFILPELRIHENVVKTKALEGYLFPLEAKTLQEQSAARRESVDERVEESDRIIREHDPDGQWLVWTNLNTEADGMATKRKEFGMMNVQGSDDNDYKAETMLGFAHGKVKELVSKPKIAGFGMNWQSCHNVIFLGISHSFESYFQAVRRCWRFGQTHPVDVYIVTADTEGNVVANIKRKERDSDILYAEMVAYMKDVNMNEIHAIQRDMTDYKPTLKTVIPSFLQTKKAQ